MSQPSASEGRTSRKSQRPSDNKEDQVRKWKGLSQKTEGSENKTMSQKTAPSTQRLTNLCNVQQRIAPYPYPSIFRGIDPLSAGVCRTPVSRCIGGGSKVGSVEFSEQPNYTK